MNNNFKIKTNYHTHNELCNHASGSPEDYILTAIENGYEVIGMSDHCAMPNPSFYRVSFEELKKYLEEVEILKEKYKNKIKVLNGLEVDFFSELMPLMKYYYENTDYIILAVHTLECNGENVYFHSSYGLTDENKLEKYKKIVVEGIKTNLFSFVAHPDIFMHGLSEVTDKHREVMEEICKVAAEYDVPLEYNANGLRRIEYNNFKREMCYPNKELFLITKKYNCKVIINGDCHDPKYLKSDDKYMNLAYKEVEEMGLNLVTEIRTRK
jgi:histidinol-phosphatase (PHP family)